MENKNNEQLNIDDGVASSNSEVDTNNVSWTEEFKTDNDKVIPNIEDIVIEESPKDETIRKAEKQIKEQNSPRGRWFTTAFFLINVLVLACVLVYQYNEFGYTKLEDFFVEGRKYRYIIYASLLVLVIMGLETLRNYALIRKATKVHRPFLAYKSVAISKYYDLITPMSTGGKASELLYLKSRGVRSGIATSIPFSKTIFNQIALITLAIILFCLNGWTMGTGVVVTTVLAIISLVINGLIMLYILFLSVSKVWAPRLILSLLKFLQKCRLIKDYNVTFKRIMRFVLEYQRSIKYYASSLKTLLASFIASYGIYICKALIAFFIYCTFNGVDTSLFTDIFMKVIICELVVKLIPLPGGTGVSEVSFTALFVSLFANGSIFWALLIWRILDYFIYIIQGILVMVYDLIIGNKKNKKMIEKFQIDLNEELDVEAFTEQIKTVKKKKC